MKQPKIDLLQIGDCEMFPDNGLQTYLPHNMPTPVDPSHIYLKVLLHKCLAYLCLKHASTT